MKRLDSALVELKLAPSRSKAQQMIEASEVEVLRSGQWIVMQQTSYQLEPSASHVRVTSDSRTLKYVSRGGLKLEGALSRTRIDPRGWRCLDVGVSTGGFTDCLLQAGAAEVIGVDVGHGQLNSKLAHEMKVKHFEGVNARELATNRQVLATLKDDLALCVVDVSFISLQQIFPVLKEILPSGCRLLALVKPQFEVGADGLDKNGVVRDENLFGAVKSNVLRALDKYGFSVADYFACDVKGQDGNQEFFVFATRM